MIYTAKSMNKNKPNSNPIKANYTWSSAPNVVGGNPEEQNCAKQTQPVLDSDRGSQRPGKKLTRAHTSALNMKNKANWTMQHPCPHRQLMNPISQNKADGHWPSSPYALGGDPAKYEKQSQF